jgi:GNAT superfamily N-acetyltransferase
MFPDAIARAVSMLACEAAVSLTWTPRDGPVLDSPDSIMPPWGVPSPDGPDLMIRQPQRGRECLADGELLTSVRDDAKVKSHAEVRISVATGADILRMIPVVNAAFAIETFLDGSRTDEERMAEMMRKGGFLLAKDDSGLVLACVYVERRGERGYFGMLAVAPSSQGRGLGRLMVEAAEDHCRRQGCKFMDLTVLSLRPELSPLYRKLGYVESGTQEFHPSRPLKEGVECHCIVMSKVL